MRPSFKNKLGTVDHTYNPNCLGGKGRRLEEECLSSKCTALSSIQSTEERGREGGKKEKKKGGQGERE